jgi:hypothetical protein
MRIPKQRYIIAACIGAFLYLILLVYAGAWIGAWDSTYAVMPVGCLPDKFQPEIASIKEKFFSLTVAKVFLEHSLGAAVKGGAIGVCIVLIWDAICKEFSKLRRGRNHV